MEFIYCFLHLCNNIGTDSDTYGTSPSCVLF
jgi:hypothetical protein